MINFQCYVAILSHIHENSKKVKFGNFDDPGTKCEGLVIAHSILALLQWQHQSNQYACVCTYTYHSYACTYTINMHAYTHKYMHTMMHGCTYTCTCTHYAHAHIHACTHTCMHTRDGMIQAPRISVHHTRSITIP